MNFNVLLQNYLHYQIIKESVYKAKEHGNFHYMQKLNNNNKNVRKQEAIYNEKLNLISYFLCTTSGRKKQQQQNILINPSFLNEKPVSLNS